MQWFWAWSLQIWITERKKRPWSKRVNSKLTGIEPETFCPWLINDHVTRILTSYWSIYGHVTWILASDWSIPVLDLIKADVGGDDAGQERHQGALLQLVNQDQVNTGLCLVSAGHVTRVLASDWSIPGKSGWACHSSLSGPRSGGWRRTWRWKNIDCP